MNEVVPYQEHYWPQVEAVFLSNVPGFFARKELEDLRTYLEKHAATYFVLFKDGDLIGCGGYHLSGPGKGRLSWDFIRKDHHRKGFGGKIVAHCLQLLSKEKNMVSVEVWTSQFATDFYGRFGFEVKQRRENHWAEGIHLLIMELQF